MGVDDHARDKDVTLILNC